MLMLVSVHGQIVINELMSNNQGTIADGDGDYSDWIELHNMGTSAVDLQGYALSDDPDSLLKWIFPSRSLPAGGFMRIWCSGKNRVATTLHTNFSIESTGETIFLSDATGNVIDNYSTIHLPADKSFGRLPDGSTNVVYLSEPSPAATNNGSSQVNGLIAEAPAFNIPGGFYTGDQVIALTHPDPSAVIHYTLDGSEPTESSPVYTGPITVQSRAGDPNVYSMIRTCYNIHFYLPDWYPPVGEVFKATVIRARAFKTGNFPGPIQTYTYFIDPSIQTRYGNLAVVSVVSDPKHLFNDTTGIYVPGINYQPGTFDANYYMNWSRPANVEMYVPGGNEAFNGNFKISINGQSSPSSPQKGLNVNASSDYGPSKIDYPLFENHAGHVKYLDKFDKVKLRAWGSDRQYGLFRDAYSIQSMAKTDMDYEAYRPVIVFINGEYWGIQELRERNREATYYESHYYIDEDNPGVDILEEENNKIVEGDSVHWSAMMNYINTHSLANQADYDYIKTQMDVNSFMLNYVHSIFYSRGDWPGQNEAKWRPRTPDGRWKWIQWDMDNTVGYYLTPWYDMLNQAITGSRGYGPSDLLNSLLANQQFKYDFINLFADYMNTEFLPPVMISTIDAMKNQLDPYMQEYKDRWQLNDNWETQVDSMKWFVNLRPVFCKEELMNHFSLNDTFKLTLDVSDTLKGNIKVNTVFLDAKTTRLSTYTYPWTGTYFSSVPVPVTAIAKPGYRFLHWLPGNDTNSTINVMLTADQSLTAVFDIDPSYVAMLPPVINEVMSSNVAAIADEYGDFDDWMEIYNPNNDTIDVGGYYLTENLILPQRFLLAPGTDSTKIPPHGHLLVWIDDDMEQGRLHTGFKFNATGDEILLIDPDGETVVDSVSFGAIASDVSYGRRYDGAADWILFNVSTPRAVNWIYTTDNAFINEVQTDNQSTYQDNYSEFNQWVELYNPNNDTLDLGGWTMTVNASDPALFRFVQENDSVKIPPHDHLVIWADNSTEQGVTHTNFTLDIPAGCVTLFKPNGDFVDSICYSLIAGDHSYGRTNDGAGTFMDFSIPTPDSANADLTQNVAVINPGSNLRVYPNPVGGNTIYLSLPVNFTIYNSVGEKVLRMRNASKADVSHLADGVYYLRTDSGNATSFIISRKK